MVHLHPGVELGELEADGEVLGHVRGLGVHLQQASLMSCLFLHLTSLHLHDPEVVCDDLPGLGVLVQPEVEPQLGLERVLRLVRIQLLTLVEILKIFLTYKKYFQNI